MVTKNTQIMVELDLIPRPQTGVYFLLKLTVLCQQLYGFRNVVFDTANCITSIVEHWIAIESYSALWNMTSSNFTNLPRNWIARIFGL